MTDETCIPFANGTEMYYWQERNCWRCAKCPNDCEPSLDDCPIYDALSMGLIGIPVPRDIAERSGWTPETRSGAWRCREFEAVTPDADN